MPQSRLTAVLGPTNTGKTHLAVTRMCGHASGMMGFPLRLLAREVYDRVVAIKGERQVALITGEEKIAPPTARYWLCTVEAMPRDVEPEFLAIDEVQLAADPDRGHVFTDRLLHRRGTAETMLLGSDTIAPLLRHLVPDAIIESRPRFSKLTYAGAKKLSRLPRRAALIAFTADEVYALAEMLRRQKGGAAVVMGALSPRTRNAQVELYQSGDVDYLVATDAIGMGLNLDLQHVAFASLTKYDGRQQRRLRPSEIAQIAGRAGRYQTDGAFGTLSFGEDEGPMLTPEEIRAVEDHEFERLRILHWRNARLDWASLPRLIASLEVPPPNPALRPVIGATDAAVLKACAADDAVAALATSPERVARLWDVCNLPDYRKTGPNAHARLIARIYRHIQEDEGIPRSWIGAELTRLDNKEGGIEPIAGRIAAARTWTYCAHRQGWVDDPEEWSARAKAVEDTLSDALHERLTQRFVDRRTSLLMKDIAGKGNHLPLEVEADGSVLVAGEAIGTLTGFRFKADPAARAGETRQLLSAAERHLPAELRRRAAELTGGPADDFSIAMTGTLPPRVLWRGARVAKMQKGADALSPALAPDRALSNLEPAERKRVTERLANWLAAEIETQLAPLRLLAEAASDEAATPAARGLSVQLIEALGVLARDTAAPLLADLSPDDHRLFGRAGIIFGPTHIFIPSLLKPRPTALRLALWATASGTEEIPQLPQPGLVSVVAAAAAPSGFYEAAGFAPFGPRAVRLDMATRVAGLAAKRRKGTKPFAADENWAHMLGLSPDDLSAFMKALGYRRTKTGETEEYRYAPHGERRRGSKRARAKDGEAQTGEKAQRRARPDGNRGGERPKRINPHSPFAALAALDFPSK